MISKVIIKLNYVTSMSSPINGISRNISMFTKLLEDLEKCDVDFISIRKCFTSYLIKLDTLKWYSKMSNVDV